MRKSVQLIFSLLFVAALVTCAVWLLWTVVAWFLTLPVASQTPIAALVGVVSVPIITYFTSRSLERRRSRENAIREKKTEIYDELIRGLMRMMPLGKAETPLSEQETLRLLADAIPNLITYGSRKVVLAWNGFRSVAIKSPGDTVKMTHAFEDLLKAMRSDLGHPTATTARGELLRMFINDYDESILRKKSK